MMAGDFMPTAHLDGVNIEYADVGVGTPIVFCHEFAGSMNSWGLQVSYFSRRHRTVSYNARGYIPSGVPASPDDYSQEHQIETLYQLLSHLGINQAYLCGLSMGAHCVLNFGLAHPEMCRGIIAAGAGTGSADAKVMARESEERADKLVAGGMGAQDTYLSGTTRIRFREKDPTGWAEFARLFLAHSAIGSANTLRGFQARRPTLYSLANEFSMMQVPALIVVGDEDDPCLEPSLFLKRTILRAGLLVLPQTGHACNLEEPLMFNQGVAEFISQVEAGRWGPRPTGSGDDWNAAPR
jgi:pimeloyl-ACP methyl ester carboxylesterase